MRPLSDRTDIITLIKLLQISELVTPTTRRSLCQDIGIEKPSQLNFINVESDDSFATQLINHLNNIGKRTSLYQLCEKLDYVFTEGDNLEELASIKRKLEGKSEEFASRYEQRKYNKNFKFLLNKVEHKWFINNLNSNEYNSSDEQALISLNFKIYGNKEPILYKSPDQPVGEKILAVFDRMIIDRKQVLLISGKGGSGKTTVLLELTRQLIERAKKQGKLLPVVLNLSLWQKDWEIDKWVIEQLYRLYQTPEEVGDKLISHNNIILLLDGFDEIRSKYQRNFIDKLNKFIDNHNIHIAISCVKEDEYNENYKRFEGIKSKIEAELKTLDINDKEYQSYLESKNVKIEILNELCDKNPNFQTLLTLPLFTEIISTLYQNYGNANLHEKFLCTDDCKGLVNSIIELYINKKLEMRDRKFKTLYRKTKTKEWLNLLAKQMAKENESIFLIERIQPKWLHTRNEKFWSSRNLYCILVGLIVGLLCGLSVGLLSDILNYQEKSNWIAYLFNGLLSGMLSGMLSGILSGILSGLTPLNWLKHFNHKWILGVGSVLIGVISGTILWLISHSNLLGENKIQVLDVLIFGIIFAIIFNRLNIQEIKPVNSIAWSWQQAKNNSIRGMFISLVIGVLMLLSAMVSQKLDLIPCSNEDWLGNFVKQVLNINKPGDINLKNFLGGLLSLEIFVGIIIAIILGFRRVDIVENHTLKPNYGIERTGKNFILLIVTGGATSFILNIIFWNLYDSKKGIIWWIYYGDDFSKHGIYFALKVAVMVGLLTGLVNGENSGIVFIKHWVLRGVLRLEHNIPFNYAAFLNHVAEQDLLRQFGGSYFFKHRLFLEYFANLKQSSSSSLPDPMDRKEILV